MGTRNSIYPGPGLVIWIFSYAHTLSSCFTCRYASVRETDLPRREIESYCGAGTRRGTRGRAAREQGYEMREAQSEVELEHHSRQRWRER